MASFVHQLHFVPNTKLCHSLNLSLVYNLNVKILSENFKKIFFFLFIPVKYKLALMHLDVPDENVMFYIFSVFYVCIYCEIVKTNLIAETAEVASGVATLLLCIKIAT